MPMFDTDVEIDMGRDMGLVHICVRIHGLSVTAKIRSVKGQTSEIFIHFLIIWKGLGLTKNRFWF
jgi:hypothetical protein